MIKLAVIGKDVSKSLSPIIHEFIASQLSRELDYQKISIPENEFEKRISGILNDYDGFNVTIPYKLGIIPHLKKIEGDARVFGAVNTVRVSDMSGHNTDGAGFALMLANNGVNVNGNEFLLLGAGGAGRSVAKKLSDGGASVIVYDKRTENSKNLEKEFGVRAVNDIPSSRFYGIINATGVGMHASEGISPVDKSVIEKCEIAIDLIYEPKKSEFLKIAEGCGKRIINGEAMLFYQAYYAQCIFCNRQANPEQAKILFNKFTEIL